MRLFTLLFFVLFCCAACFKKGYNTPPRVLIFSKTAGYRHASISKGIAALRQICNEHGIWADTTENAEDFNEKNLKRYAAVIFLSTTGDVLNPNQENAFERYIQAGGGFMGIHAASDTEYQWAWFGGLVGGYFNGHPPGTAEADLKVTDKNHASTHLLPEVWRRRDEWYNFKNLNPNTKVLLTIDESTYEGGTNGDPHPMSWYHAYDGGRAWYTAGGHTNETFEEPLFLTHLWGGLKYVIGENAKLSYQRCRTPAVPDPTRFVKTVLASDLTEPMEMTMLPNGKVVLIERRGYIKVFDPANGLLSVAHKLNVHSEYEDGLMGCAIDENFEQNNWLYLYYSPVGQSLNRLSRFKFRDEHLDIASEQVILEVATQRDECCHTAGSITFDATGLLYLSTGDNTNPFASEGFSPIDERTGRSPWDAQKSSANTNDLRGKILRIRVNEDGTYTCPADNLFGPASAETAKGIIGRPEIYVMGCRNPFRISVDSRRNMLFWGEVGPDAGEPDTARGPQGHDEVNRAKKAGFFGWPMFVGNNKPYRDYNYGTLQKGPLFSVEQPVNNSPNNTGSTLLPPAQPALIWYPYGNSEEFPLVRNGGRNAMAGPVFYADEYPADTRFPEYYNGKLIIYDWMRNWMMAVTLDSLGDFSRMEPIGDSIQLSRPMDMFFDKTGALWVLEYGTQWFSSNPDARLSRIDYFKGNRPPQAVLQVSEPAAAAPAQLVFSLDRTRDYDGDRLKYILDFGDKSPLKIIDIQSFEVKKPIAYAGVELVSEKAGQIAHTYQQSGNYEAQLTVIDEMGARSTVKQMIRIGNEPPAVTWDLNGHNRSFYHAGTLLQYQVKVQDREDGAAIDPRQITATKDYLANSFDMTMIAQGHQTAKSVTEYARGKILHDKSDCKTCHAVDRKVNGPSYQQIAERYRNNDFAVADLTKKVIKGGSGNWGTTVMSAHPQLKEEEATEIVRWILTVNTPAPPKSTFPAQGILNLSPPPAQSAKETAWPGTYILQATYRDRGSAVQSPLESTETLVLRSAYQQAEKADSLSTGLRTYQQNNDPKSPAVVRYMNNGAFLMYKRADLQGLLGVSLGISSNDKNLQSAGGSIEIRLDHPNGLLLGQAKVTIPAVLPNGQLNIAELNIPIAVQPDGAYHNLFIVTRNNQVSSDQVAAIDWVRFELQSLNPPTN
jgi:cytochrome c